MFSMNAGLRTCTLLILGAVLCGCLPSSQSPLDEQKEMHFLAGKAKESALDYQGAIEAFERALEANPKNGSAHFELGLLFEKEEDFSAAIYHLERFLKLRPNSDYADIVRERISADKVELSKTAAFAPVQKQVQKQIEDLAATNSLLKAEVERLQAENDQWRSHYASQSQSRPASTLVAQTAASATGVPGSPTTASTGSATRTHTVKAGDTLTSIAGRYGVKLDALTASNPGIDPRKMRIGQILTIPAH